MQRHRRGGKRFPDVRFLIYHSGFVTSVKEGPYGQKDGIDTLIRSLEENGVEARLQRLRRARQHLALPDARSRAGRARDGKAHQALRRGQRALGTDSIWYGSPQDQITAFRTFQISQDFRDKYAYPEITPALRAKIFGLNAAKVYGISADEVKKVISRDRISAERMAYSEQPNPHFLTYGPKTRREFLALGG